MTPKTTELRPSRPDRRPLDPAGFLSPAIAANYPHKDYYRSYFGEIVAVTGTDVYA